MLLLSLGQHNHDDRVVDDINFYILYFLCIFYSPSRSCPGHHNHDDRGIDDDYSYDENGRGDDNGGEDVR